jgi:hypothetical protein
VNAYTNIWQDIGNQVGRELRSQIAGDYRLQTANDFDRTMIALKMAGQKVVLFFDEVDELLGIDKSAKDGFLGELRTLKGTVVQVPFTSHSTIDAVI